MKFSNLFKFNKKEHIRAIRLKEIQEPKPRWQNPYFPKERPPKDNKERFKKWLWQQDGWAYFGILILLIGSLGYIIFGTKYFIIKNINITGNKNITTEEINNILNPYLEKKFLFLIPHNNYWFFNTNRGVEVIQNSVSNKFALESVKIEKKWPDTINLSITERIPGLVWMTNNNYYYLDLKGIATQKIDKIEDINADFPKITDLNNKPVELDKQVINEKIVNYILNLEKNFTNQTSLKIDSYSIPEVTCQEQEYKLEKYIQEDIKDTEDEETKAKKEAILKEYNAGELTVEESLSLLEQINNEQKANNNVNQTEKMAWKEVYTPIECDLTKVATEIDAETENFNVLFDVNLDLNNQLEKLKKLMNSELQDLSVVNDYIDLRFSDKIYYK
jgi:cell division septal protein FtsQ